MTLAGELLPDHRVDQAFLHLLDVHSPSPQDMDFAAMILVGGFFVSVGAIFVMLWLAMGLIFGL